MTIIYAATEDQHLVGTIIPKLAQNNINTVRLHVVFDNSWNSYSVRSAIFTTSKSERPYLAIIAAGGDCLIPSEVLAEECKLHIVVKGENLVTGETKASTRLTVKVLGGHPAVIISDPSPSVYQQLMTANALLTSRMGALEAAGTVDGSEVVGIRTGADGTVYTTAGDAVREQFAKNKSTSYALAKGVSRLVYERYRLYQESVLVEERYTINSNEYALTGYTGVVLYPIEAMLPIINGTPAYNLIFELHCDVEKLDVYVAVTNYSWGPTSLKYYTRKTIYKGINYVELNLSNWEAPYENEVSGVVNKIAVFANSGFLDGVTVKGVYAISKHGYGVEGYIAETVASQKVANALADSKSPWKNKTWLAYGDSITAQCNGNELNKGWAQYVNAEHGFATFYGRGVGGQRYCYNTATWYANADGTYAGRYGQNGLTAAPTGTTTHNGSFCSWDRITKMIPSDIREDIDLVTIMGGTNDIAAGIDEVWAKPVWSADNKADTHWSADGTYYNGGDFDTNSFVGAIASTIMKMQIWCPNAVIVVLTPISRWVDFAHYGNKGLTLQDVSDLIKKTAAFMGVDCIDLNAICGINGFNYNTYISDGIHPNTAGLKLMGRALNGALNGICPRL